MRLTPSIFAAFAASLLTFSCAATPRHDSFATPEEAMQRLEKAIRDETATEEILGPGGFQMVRTGDEAEDKHNLDTFTALLREKLEFEEIDKAHRVAILGRDRWEFPIPLALEDGRWRFDVVVGRKEILTRRIGRNELFTLDTLRAIVDAQREYATMPREGATRAFARRIASLEGQRDGLYWPTNAGEPSSPLGLLVAEAFSTGPGAKEPIPYHGYCFRLLTAQGASAPGGARSYLDTQGLLTGGFAVIAWPVAHGNSGNKTFLVNHQRIVFEKDLGPDTSTAAAAITVFDPDATWEPSWN